MYTIGQVAEMFGLPVSTLRYYDKQGLFLGLGGRPAFADSAIRKPKALLGHRMLLKKAGMETGDIRLFMEWCAEGPLIPSARLCSRNGGPT